MRGTWKVTGPGRGTWTTSDSNVPWPLIDAVVIAVLITAGAAGVAKSAWRNRAELELIFGAGVALLVVMITVTVLVYRRLHPRCRPGRAGELPAGQQPAGEVTATVVPRVTGTAGAQALPAAPGVVVNYLVIGDAAAAALLHGGLTAVRVVPAEARGEIER